MAVFAFTMAYIWDLRYTHPWSLVPVLALIVASHVWRRERFSALGLRTEGFRQAARTFGPLVIALALFLFCGAFAMGTMRPLGIGGIAKVFALYLPWGLFQQYLMHGYFLRRFEAVFSPAGADILTASLFCLVHAPNWFLMLVTFVGAFLAIAVYRRHRNLFFLGTAHAVLGCTLFMAVPDSVSHHLRIGPGWYAPPSRVQSAVR